MASTYSTNLGLELITTGEQAGTWGTTTNTNLGTLIEQAISGYTTQAITDGADTTITIPDGATGVARNMFLQLTGTLTAARNLIVPAKRKIYFIFNNTSGGFAVTVKVAAQTGVSVPANTKVILVCNGTDIIAATSYAAISPATPTASVGLTAVAGTSTTGYMRSDGAPALSQSIAPTWTGAHTFNGTVAGTGMNNFVATYLSSPGAIGGTTPGAGTFTSLVANTSFTGAGANAFLNSPPSSIGTTSPSGGRFTFAHTAPVAVTFNATTMAVDCSLANVFTTTFTANVTTAPTISNAKDGQTINWFITQDATGSRTMTWPAAFKWPGGTAGVLSTGANNVDLLVATYRSATGFWYASLLKNFA